MMKPGAWSHIVSRCPLRVKRKYISASPLDTAAYFAWLSILTGNAVIPSFCSNRNQTGLLKKNPTWLCLHEGNTVTQESKTLPRQWNYGWELVCGMILRTLLLQDSHCYSLVPVNTAFTLFYITRFSFG